MSPIQPVIITDECGNMTGIPLPLRLAYADVNNATNILPYGTVVLFNAVFSATERRFITHLEFQIFWIKADSITAFQSWKDAIQINLYRGAVAVVREVIRDLPVFPATIWDLSYFKITLPQPLEIVAGGIWRADIINYTQTEINQTDCRTWYTPV